MKKFIRRALVLTAILSLLCCNLAIPATAIEANEYSLQYERLPTDTYSVYDVRLGSEVLWVSVAHLYDATNKQFLDYGSAYHDDAYLSDDLITLECATYRFHGNQVQGDESGSDSVSERGYVASVNLVSDIYENTTKVISAVLATLGSYPSVDESTTFLEGDDFTY